MKITSIKVGTKICPDPMYCHTTVDATAIVDDEESANDCATKLADFIDWHAKKSSRDATARDMQKVIDDPNSDEAGRAKAQSWMDKYNARKAEVEAM